MKRYSDSPGLKQLLVLPVLIATCIHMVACILSELSSSKTRSATMKILHVLAEITSILLLLLTFFAFGFYIPVFAVSVVAAIISVANACIPDDPEHTRSKNILSFLGLCLVLFLVGVLVCLMMLLLPSSPVRPDPPTQKSETENPEHVRRESFSVG